MEVETVKTMLRESPPAVGSPGVPLYSLRIAVSGLKRMALRAG